MTYPNVWAKGNAATEQDQVTVETGVGARQVRGVRP